MQERMQGGMFLSPQGESWVVVTVSSSCLAGQLMFSCKHQKVCLGSSSVVSYHSWEVLPGIFSWSPRGPEKPGPGGWLSSL